MMNLTKDTFDGAIHSSPLPVLVDFWATWCVPCKMQSQALETFSLRNSDKVTVYKVNVDDEPELAARYQIKGIPMLYFFKDGKIVRSAAGYHTAEELEKKFLPYCK